MTTMTHSGCGGTLLVSGGSGEQKHEYCDRCGAFRYCDGGDDDFPTGRDEAENRQARDDGKDRSPEDAS